MAEYNEIFRISRYFENLKVANFFLARALRALAYTYVLADDAAQKRLFVSVSFWRGFQYAGSDDKWPNIQRFFVSQGNLRTSNLRNFFSPSRTLTFFG